MLSRRHFVSAAFGASGGLARGLNSAAAISVI
jgi:hypothetical protein